MKRVVSVLAVLLGSALPAPGAPRGGFGHHGGSFHRPFFHGGFRGRSRVFIGGSVFLDPFFPYWYPYSGPYPYPVYPYPAYPYPPPDEEATAEPPPEEGEEAPSAEDVERTSYGLVQLRGVPDGASVDLDGRFWITADSLDERWLALPRGAHTIAVRVRGAKPVERRVEVKPGGTQAVRFGPFPRHAG
jgi:hypothetical protein